MTKLDFFASVVSLLAFNQSQTFCNSMLITLSSDFKSLSAHSRVVSSANLSTRLRRGPEARPPIDSETRIRSPEK